VQFVHSENTFSSWTSLRLEIRLLPKVTQLCSTSFGIASLHRSVLKLCLAPLPLLLAFLSPFFYLGRIALWLLASTASVTLYKYVYRIEAAQDLPSSPWLDWETVGVPPSRFLGRELYTFSKYIDEYYTQAFYFQFPVCISSSIRHVGTLGKSFTCSCL